MVNSILYAFAIFISISALIVSMMNISKAIFLGAWSMCISIFLIYCLHLSEIEKTDLYSVLLDSGNALILLTLILFYNGYCLLKNKTYIMDKSMPDSWYLFSYFTISLMFINSILLYLSTQKNSIANSFLIIGNSLLFAMIVIETIICVSYRTDGFTL
jgi:hypothetical protein